MHKQSKLDMQTNIDQIYPLSKSETGYYYDGKRHRKLNLHQLQMDHFKCLKLVQTVFDSSFPKTVEHIHGSISHVYNYILDLVQKYLPNHPKMTLIMIILLTELWVTKL